MTSLLTITTFLGLVGVCYIMAKYNKNDNLFWALLISLFAGMAGGAIFNKLNKHAEKKNVNLTQVYNPTQVSPAICADFYTELGDALAYTAKPASKDIEIPVSDSEVDNAPSKVYGEIRGQPTNVGILNKGGPTIMFDTS